ncbi:isopenicillin N synthase family dioxygenase [Sphingoaurantiacus capsulatus]|uniref:2-oxoglutarate-dependent ethylene/succinate-forming enzyme n=1 Tax=Sphingoaurantiacus capsulatus TaxID=1771310 RepID=A0ABV7X8S6_9SPHN
MADAAPAAIQPVSMGLAATDPDRFAEELGDSFRRTGFAVVADHGIDQGVIDRAVEDTKAFFALPEGLKRRYHLPGTGGARGLTPFGVETAKDAKVHDLKEFWHVGRDLPDAHPYRRYMPENLWPTEVAGFHTHVKTLYDALDEMGATLLRAIARYLKLDERFFDDKVRLGNSVLRLLHYPPVPMDAPGVRAGAHEDINVITLLLGAEEAGLEVKTRDGQWLAITPPEGALVVNVGDMLQRLTNHYLPSTTHRVVNPAPERRGLPRYSTPFFLHFEPEFAIRTLPGCVTPETPDRYPEAITADEYLQQRLREIKLI